MKNAAQRRPHQRGASPGSMRAAFSEEESHTKLVADWAATRAGARAGRGFHFQDVVGAWLAIRLAVGELAGELVPEGFDDMTLEGDTPTNFQVKSRQNRLGAFPLGIAAGHVLDSWATNCDREQPTERLVVVLERGVAADSTLGTDDGTHEIALHSSSPLGQRLKAEATRRGMSTAAISDLVGATTVVGISWDELDSQIDALLANLMPRIAREGRRLVARSVTATIAEATDKNAAVTFALRDVLDRTRILERIQRDAEQIDVDALERALSEGICEFLDYTELAGGSNRFYEGEAVQPGHVTSGLVSPRPDLVADVLAAAKAGQPIVLNGPSGVGKSAVLWTVPFAMRGVLWVRVRRLESHSDAVALSRLARAHGASANRPVGFLVDGAGSARLRAWPELLEQTMGQNGIVFVASVRNEDLLQLGDLAGCATVAVALDKATAETIYEGLVRRGATEAPHWREAFEQAEGLTLEFTHILSRGRRLRDVIDDQVATRVREHRTTELDLLALVSVAHRWGGSLEVARVVDRLGDADVRRAVERLIDEHLLVEMNGDFIGLHPIRSEVITESVHATPPPIWSTTVEDVLELLNDDQLPRFVSQLLRDRPDHASTVVEFGLSAGDHARRVARVLEGLRLWDHEQQVREWLRIQNEEGVFPSVQLMTTLLAIADTDIGDLTPAPVLAALGRMADVPPGDSQGRLVARMSESRLRRLVLSAGIEDARVLLSALGGSSVDLALPLQVDDPTLLLDELRKSDLQQVSDLLAAARNCSEDLVGHLVDALGGEPAVLEMIRSQCPWLLQVEIRIEGAERIGHARILHISDEVHDDAHRRVTDFAQILLRTLPSIDRTDVKVLLPGGQPYMMEEFDLGSTGLVRRNDYDASRVMWNQARMAVARSLIGRSDSTRLTAAAPIIRDLASFVRDFGNRWVRRDMKPVAANQLIKELDRLSDAAHQIRPSIARHQSATVQDDPVDVGGGDLLSFIAQITDNAIPRLVRDGGSPALIAFLTETILPGIATAEDEPWHLIRDSTSVIDSLRRLSETIEMIAMVLRKQQLEGDAPTQLLQAARKVSRSRVLAAAARPAKASLVESREGRRASLETILSARLGQAVSLIAEDGNGKTGFALIIDVPTLFDWAINVADFVEAVEEHRREHEQFLIVPTRRGQRIEGIGVNLIMDPLPLMDVGSWVSLLPDRRETNLADCIDKAVSSLQWMSGLNDLDPSKRRLSEVSSLETRARKEHELAMADLATGMPDEFRELALTVIGGWAVSVHAETVGGGSPPTFAANCAAGILGAPNDLVGAIAELRFAAIEWEIDPAAVRQHFGW